eukprot:PhF_6_TR37786/c0_g1_i1/m.56246
MFPSGRHQNRTGMRSSVLPFGIWESIIWWNVICILALPMRRMDSYGSKCVIYIVSWKLPGLHLAQGLVDEFVRIILVELRLQGSQNYALGPQYGKQQKCHPHDRKHRHATMTEASFPHGNL